MQKLPPESRETQKDFLAKNNQTEVEDNSTLYLRRRNQRNSGWIMTVFTVGMQDVILYLTHETDDCEEVLHYESMTEYVGLKQLKS